MGRQPTGSGSGDRSTGPHSAHPSRRVRYPAAPRSGAWAGDGARPRGPVHGQASVRAAPDPTAVAAEVLASRRYRWLAPAFVERVARTEAPKEARQVEAVKRTKRRLHQIFGAYVFDLDPDQAAATLAAAGDDPTALRAACRALMAGHASTRERLDVLDTFYRRIFQVTGPPGSLLDLACGLGPLAAPWMDLPVGVRYNACDVDQRIVRIVDVFLGVAQIHHEVTLHDVLSAEPLPSADVALLLKSAPCLDQQAPGATRSLLERVDAPHVVVSYPTRSIGGAGKGMAAHYRTTFGKTIAGLGSVVAELQFPSELVFVVRR